MFDLVIAVAHHLLIFALFGIVAAEFITVRRGMNLEAVRRVAAIDLWYGVLACLILAVGFSRAVFAAKGWPYYSHNLFFWAKIGTFALIGLLSAPPTLAFIRWKKIALAPNDAQVAAVRLFLWMEVILFGLVLTFAAAMARGYGQFAGG